MSEADADDVAQVLLLKLLEGFRTYNPKKGRFRHWLKAATRNTSRRLVAREQRARGAASDEKLWALLCRPEADEALTRLMDRIFDQEVLSIACQRVQMEVSRIAWEAFRRKVLEEEPVTAVACELHTTEAAVSQACYRVRIQLRQEIQRLEDGASPPGHESS